MPRALTSNGEHVLYEFFLWSVLLKLAISLAEVAAGTAVLLAPPARLVEAAVFLLNYLPIPALQHALFKEVAAFTASTALFVSFYLLSRGLIKVFLLVAVLKSKLWAYPASLIVLALLICYQLYQIATTGSLIVSAITLFDLVVMYFIFREWRVVLRHQAPHQQL